MSDERRMMLLHKDHGDLVEWALTMESSVARLRDENEQLRGELEAAKEANRWIPVSERMPEHWRPVLMQTTTGNIYGARYHESAHQWTTDCGLYFHGESLKQVVFWRPFPEPQETSEA